jgi:uncharacterized phage protein gp47/JayE
MPLLLPSLDEIVERALVAFRTRFPGKDTGTESFLGKIARALGMTVLGFLQAVKIVESDAVPSERSSSEGLDVWAETLAIPAGGDGRYGRRRATYASGGQGLCTGTLGTTFPDGAFLTAPDGTEVRLSGTVTIPGLPPGVGSVAGSFVALTGGSAGNLERGTVLTWQSTPTGADDTVTLTAPLSGAVDVEDDTGLLGRTRDRLQRPPKGGSASDFRRWAESVPGVSRAFVYPLRGGTATVHVVLVAAGSGTARRPAPGVRAAVEARIIGSLEEEGTRPVTVEEVLALEPAFAQRGMALRLRVVPSKAKHAFDWSSGAVPLTVASYVPGPPATITLAAVAPPSLVTAIASRPRIQVTGSGRVSPQLVRVTAIDVLNRVLTLEDPLPRDFAPPAQGDTAHPGGGAVLPVALEARRYVDSLGASRESGYADPYDVWEDTCSIFRLADVALAARDPGGDAVVRDVLGVTIDGAAVSRRARDITLQGPELLHCDSIAVTD